jgi:rfaE bifunctional protein nucleotidyltransferase chain/domain
MSVGFADKICDAQQALARLSGLRNRGPVVFTNGVFDVLHRGHATYLEQALALGATLVVGVNTDASAKRLGKGPERPLNTQHDRALLIAALASVSLVVLFDEDTPEALIDQLRPDIYVKGGDYDMARLGETALVRSWGGHAVAIPFVSGYSTSALVTKIQNATQPR